MSFSISPHIHSHLLPPPPPPLRLSPSPSRPPASCEASNDPTAHAEVLCIREASEALGQWRHLAVGGTHWVAASAELPAITAFGSCLSRVFLFIWSHVLPRCLNSCWRLCFKNVQGKSFAVVLFPASMTCILSGTMGASAQPPALPLSPSPSSLFPPSHVTAVVHAVRDPGAVPYVCGGHPAEPPVRRCVGCEEPPAGGGRQLGEVRRGTLAMLRCNEPTGNRIAG